MGFIRWPKGTKQLRISAYAWALSVGTGVPAVFLERDCVDLSRLEEIMVQPQLGSPVWYMSNYQAKKLLAGTLPTKECLAACWVSVWIWIPKGLENLPSQTLSLAFATK